MHRFDPHGMAGKDLESRLAVQIQLPGGAIEAEVGDVLEVWCAQGVAHQCLVVTADFSAAQVAVCPLMTETILT